MAEIRSFAGLTLLNMASWDAEWNRYVFQSDSSGTGHSGLGRVGDGRGAPRAASHQARMRQEREQASGSRVGSGRRGVPSRRRAPEPLLAVCGHASALVCGRHPRFALNSPALLGTRETELAGCAALAGRPMLKRIQLKTRTVSLFAEPKKRPSRGHVLDRLVSRTRRAARSGPRGVEATATKVRTISRKATGVRPLGSGRRARDEST